jgi:hypothetical protein
MLNRNPPLKTVDYICVVPKRDSKIPMLPLFSKTKSFTAMPVRAIKIIDSATKKCFSSLLKTELAGIAEA